MIRTQRAAEGVQWGESRLGEGRREDRTGGAERGQVRGGAERGLSRLRSSAAGRDAAQRHTL